MRDRKWSRNLAEARAISPVLESWSSSPGPTDGIPVWKPLRPSPDSMTLSDHAEHRPWTPTMWSYFRWRTCTVGTEIYWHGILDYSGRDNRRLAEVKEIHKKVGALAPVTGAHYRAEVGIVKDYDNIWMPVWTDGTRGWTGKAAKDCSPPARKPIHPLISAIWIICGRRICSRIKSCSILMPPL